MKPTAKPCTRRIATRRLTRVGLVLIAAVAVPQLAMAQPAAKVYRIGVLANALETSDGASFQMFLETLRKLGYVADKNMMIEWRSSEAESDRLPALAAELVRAKVDVIVATSLQPARAAAEATKAIPIVFVVLADPVGQGLVDNPARPTANVTGFAAYGREESSDKVLELLKTALPGLSRAAVLANPTNPVHKELMPQVLPSSAQRHKMTLVPLEVRSPADLQGALDTAVRERAEAMYVLADVLTFILRPRIIEFAMKNRLPTIHTSRASAEAGALMAYGPNLRELYGRAAGYVDKILKGAKASELPVEQSRKFELIVNLKTAKTLGLTIPPSLLHRADNVIQ